MPPKKQKWTHFNPFAPENSDSRLTEHSASSRAVSNPTPCAQRSLHTTERRAASEYQSRPTEPKKPLGAAELQKLHEELECKAREESEERKRLEDARSPPLPPSLNPLDYPPPPGAPLRETTNCQSVLASASANSNYSHIFKPVLAQEDAIACQEQSYRDRSDSVGPLSNESFSGEAQCSSPSPDSGVVTIVATTTTSDDMASAPVRISGRPNRYENRPPMNTTLCRNGPQCRKLQEGTCNFNHDFTSMAPNGLNASVDSVAAMLIHSRLNQDSSKRSLNVDSPSFTPTPKNATVQPAKIGISPKAAAAATFTPRGSGSVTPATNSHSKEPSADFIPQQAFQQAQQFQEFVPGQSFLTSPQMDPQQPQLSQQMNAFDNTFLTQQTIAALDSQAQINPYVQQASNVGNQPFFQDASSYKHPLNYHLYASIGPRRENLMAYQRSSMDFFIQDQLREDLQRKAEATLQTYANSALPQTVEYFHSLVALDTNNAKGASTFGYQSWIYKATSSKDGHTYALRRIEGFRLSSEAAIRTINSWKRITNSSLVQVYDAFTGRWFGDSSLIVVTDYHPRSQTVAEKHFAVGRHPHRAGAQVTPENELWGYIVQLASALKAIHEGGAAAQTITPSKVLVTSKNRLRVNGCGVLDIITYEQRKPLHELQRADLQDLGRLILGIAARSPTAYQNSAKSLELVSRSYSERLRACIAWLVAPPPLQQNANQPTEAPMASAEYNVNALLNNIADKIVSVMDSTLHVEDQLTSELMRELENGRVARLLAKLNIILERPDISISPNSNTPATLNQPSAAWSETGERYYLKLFRDYVFHQVDADGRPVLDLGHILTCLNKLDAGIDEKIQLISRDEQSNFVTSYKEVKRGFEAAWAEIRAASNPSRR